MYIEYTLISAMENASEEVEVKSFYNAIKDIWIRTVYYSIYFWNAFKEKVSHNKNEVTCSNR